MYTFINLSALRLLNSALKSPSFVVDVSVDSGGSSDLFESDFGFLCFSTLFLEWTVAVGSPFFLSFSFLLEGETIEGSCDNDSLDFDCKP